jgi:hypothetical protein
MRPLTNILLLSLLLERTALATDFVYRWSDAQGQAHFSDSPPLAENSEAIKLESTPHAEKGVQGLRPGERASLGAIERRQKMQQARSRARRSNAEEQRASLLRQCRSHREMLKLAEGRDGFKQHARFLRNNCW